MFVSGRLFVGYSIESTAWSIVLSVFQSMSSSPPPPDIKSALSQTSGSRLQTMRTSCSESLLSNDITRADIGSVHGINVHSNIDIKHTNHVPNTKTEIKVGKPQHNPSSPPSSSALILTKTEKKVFRANVPVSVSSVPSVASPLSFLELEYAYKYATKALATFLWMNPDNPSFLNLFKGFQDFLWADIYNQQLFGKICFILNSLLFTLHKKYLSLF